MKIYTTRQMKAAEAGAVLTGTSYLQLMRRAGTAAADLVGDLIPMEGRSCLLFCGKGNNGGDGFVAASRLRELGAKVAVVLTDGYPTTREAKEAYDQVEAADVPVALYAGNEEKIRQLCGHTDVIVDAIYGTGFRPPLDDLHREMCDTINRSICAVVALDLPSGVAGDTAQADPSAIRADFTVVFHAQKPAHLADPGAEHCGRIIMADIGIPDDMPAEEGPAHTLVDRDFVLGLLPPRERATHKGDYGRLLCVVGSDRYMGAAALAAEGAARCGAGYVQVASTPEVCRFVAARTPSCILLPWKDGLRDDLEGLEQEADRASALLLGCGLGDSQETADLTARLVGRSQVPVVLDADGLNAAARNIDILSSHTCDLIITPHLGELARLADMDVEEAAANRLELASALARQHRMTVVLKGPTTTVHTQDGDVYYSTVGNPGMARAGSGDVLAGMVAALAARGLEPAQAAACGAWIHGSAGDLAAARCSQEAMLPTDLLACIGSVFLQEDART